MACGIDESGTAPGDDASGPDVSLDAPGPTDSGGGGDVKDVVNELPPSCTTLDVSACADAGIPDGWAPVITSNVNTGCPDTLNYAAQAYVDTLGTSGSCACGCTTSGSYNCVGDVEYSQNCNSCGSGIGSCDKPPHSVTVGDDASCFATYNGTDFAIGPTPTVSGSVTCNASTTSTPTPTSQNITVCTITNCSATYCAVVGYNRCIWSATETSCPAPFTNQDTVGKSTDISVSCGCNCAASPTGSCAAAVTLYQGAGCSGAANGSVLKPPACTTTGQTNIASFGYMPSVPAATCDASAGSPTVGFGSTQTTVCCLP